MPQMLSEALEPTSVLWYGEGGTGKTTNLCAMARLGKIWVCNAESGIKRRALEDHGIPIENIEVYPDPGQGEDVSFDGLESEWKRIREELHGDPTAYIGVGLDSITEVQQKLKDDAVQGSVVRAGRAGRDRSRWVVDQDNWRETNEQCRDLLRKFRDLPCHFAATALSRREQDAASQVVYQPGVTPSLQGDVVLWFDAIGHTDVVELEGEEYFRGLFRAVGKYRGKDRNNALPKYVISPTFDRIQAYVEGELTLEGDADWEVYSQAAERVLQEQNAAEAVAPAAS